MFMRCGGGGFISYSPCYSIVLMCYNFSISAPNLQTNNLTKLFTIFIVIIKNSFTTFVA